MRYFVYLLDPDGQGISDEVRQGYESLPRRRGLEFMWRSLPSASALAVWDDSWGDPLIAQHGRWMAAGIVRLDNRADVERYAGSEGERLTDLEIVLRLIVQHGTQYVPQLVGDFAFVVWDDDSRTMVSACDAFAVKKLYYAERGGLLGLASRAEALALEESYDVEYLARLVALCSPARDLSVYAGVRSVPAASMALLEHGALRVRRYWNAADFEVQNGWANSEKQVVETCRRLLVESVCQRLGSQGEVWGQLSGGLDSSSIVSLIQWLSENGEIPHGLAGTVTYVDRQGTAADERLYSDTVVQRWRLRNETIVDAPTWYDSRCPLPRTDQPNFHFPFHPRDQRVSALIRGARGRVLLTGWGGDELWMSSMLFFADWVAQGHLWSTVREMVRRAAMGRVSFWELAFKNALLPLLPRRLQDRLVNDGVPIQPWLEPTTLQRYGLTARSPTTGDYAGPIGQKYRHAVAAKTAVLADLTPDRSLNDSLDVRNPFMHRPLVEFALRLPPEVRSRPTAHRWVLREAMQGILPNEVRARVGKPELGEALAWSLTMAREALLPLLREPILAELGVVNADELRAGFDGALRRTGCGEYMHAALHSTLSVEAWLQMRSGRWPHGGHQGSRGSATGMNTGLSASL